jgi:hypothetical protein
METKENKDNKDSKDNLSNGTAAGDVGSDELRKPHEMIVMMPRSGRITLTGRRIYNALLHQSQTQMMFLNQMPAADFLFRAPLISLLRATGGSGEQRTAAKKYLKEMRGLEVDWESAAPGDGVKWKGFSMLSEVHIEERNGENWVAWSYPPTLMIALREPTRWARLDLEVLGRLSTYTALALYEICARYRDNPSGLTSRKSVNWWSDALSHTPAGSERREWRKFKNEKLKPAIAEVNRETEIDIDLIEHKQGRSINEAQFSVKKKHRMPSVPKAQVVDISLIQKAFHLGIRETKLDPLIQEFGEDMVQSCMTQLEARVANRQFKPIENTYSYLRTLLRNGNVIADADPKTNAAAQSASESTSKSKAETPDASKEVPRTLAAIDQEQAQKMRTLRAQLEAMAPDQRRVYVSQAVDRLKENGLFTPVIRRRFEQGDELHGVLGAMVIQCYALAIEQAH